ncbi:hypothetical protein AN639_06795 [Candidatus Epulonipiscium fishelsonii]|uniref:Uncharacterized protein n=1 Tax=Candidatus Epulonipiscium fishelsonii TaxID=77094 RepID=A0ACC8X9I3_9FIRM|nr:hypothetical protein AN396_10175 [Epulopiscium sp. SCG-B11WGA-EpuloA1]ONI39012.1 hypothetical protein AN639_06795 [Epulopiscium sp. SCG-B05WGA-EpuloA1]
MSGIKKSLREVNKLGLNFGKQSNNAEDTIAFQKQNEFYQNMSDENIVFKSHQYKYANSVPLQTIYEEISLLWNTEPKYRENFKVEGDTVTIPVLFAKISGVAEASMAKYWTNIRKLCTADTIVIKDLPFVKIEKSFKLNVENFYRNGILHREKIKIDKHYPFGLLRLDMQEHILNKMEALLEGNLIIPKFDDLTTKQNLYSLFSQFFSKPKSPPVIEHIIISTILNLDKEVLKYLQEFDFGKFNPKVIYINTSQRQITLQDSIVLMFLSLLGFDILFFVPTGYASIENYFTQGILEHQVGKYVYDAKAPNIRYKKSLFYKFYKTN